MITGKGQVTNIKVYCRFRQEDEGEEPIKIHSDPLKSGEIEVYQQKDPENALKFEFEQVFLQKTTQEEVFKTAAQPIVEDVVQGFNGTIIANGQTASGKTYTITGSDIFDPNAMGIVPRMISTVFDHIDTSENTLEFSIKVSYCELYLEKILDLTEIEKKGLKIRESKSAGFYIQNLAEHYVSSDFEVFEILRVGTENRHMMSTKMNSRSSRSHTVFTVTINIHSSIDLSGRTGKLVIVDLAGSERVSKTGAEGVRLKELKNINKSLNALTSVINALTDSKAQHIPYRDSKLTKILSNSLGGNSKTAIIITCSSQLKNESETVTTLRFGAIAMSIKNKPKINRELTMAELKLKLIKIEEELKKKAVKIMALEDALNKLNIPFDAFNSANDKSEYASETAVTDNDEYLVELEDVSDKLNMYIEENSKKKKLFNEIKIANEDLESKYSNEQALIAVLEEKHQKIEVGIRNKSALLHKYIIEKEVLSEKIEKSQTKKIELERILNEKTAEYNDLSQKYKAREEKDMPGMSAESLEEQKEKLLEEQNKYKRNQSELQEIQLRLNLALQEQLSTKISEEKSILIREISARDIKLKLLEDEIEGIEDSTKLIKKILTQDESTLNLDTDELERKLKELTEMYKQLVAKQSSSNIEKQINVRKVSRLNEKISGLEKDLERKQGELAKVETEANKFLDDIASQSICNKIRVPIKGGGGKNVRNYSFSRLSLKPRQYSSMKFN